MEQDRQADAAAVKAVLAGDKNRFRELVTRHQRSVFLTTFRMVGRRAEAEDLTQQTLVEGYAALARYDQRRSFRTWLLRIAVNNSKDFLKSHKRKERSLSFDADQSRAMFSGAVDGPERATERHHKLERIAEALGQLSDKYRVPVILRDVEGLSYAEMREVLDLSLPTLKIRVVRGRKQLQGLLEDLRHGQ